MKKETGWRKNQEACDREIRECKEELEVQRECKEDKEEEKKREREWEREREREKNGKE